VVDKEQGTWWDLPAPPVAVTLHHPRATDPNPLIALYGSGPSNAWCGTCTHLVRKRYAKTYRKCDQRRMTASEATDHFATWPACGRYHPEEAD
jgi:hypothetical protein